MTFLEICKAVRQECGISGVGPLTVNSQNGEMKRIVDWVAASWRDIQMRQPNWQWMRGGFTLPLVASTHTYSPADASITDFSSWNLEHIRIYKDSVVDEFTLSYLPYDDFREVYMRGSIPTGKPAYFTVTPDKGLRFYPTPSDTYTVYGDYYTTPTALTIDTDVPAMPVRFHDLLMYRAMMKYGAFEEAMAVFQYASGEYNRLLRNLEQDQLPDMPTSEPLI